MLVVFKGQTNEHILVFDAEYNEGDLIQFSGMLFRKIEADIYQIEKSLNRYVKLEEGRLNYFIKDFTGITDDYLEKNGMLIEKAAEEIYDLMDVPNLLVVSHGLYNDRQTMLSNGISMYLTAEDEEIEGTCSYNMGKRLLKREKNLSLKDMAMDAGVFLSNHHNAFDDAWATVAVFSLLCKLNEEDKNERRIKKSI